MFNASLGRALSRFSTPKRRQVRSQFQYARQSMLPCNGPKEYLTKASSFFRVKFIFYVAKEASASETANSSLGGGL